MDNKALGIIIAVLFAALLTFFCMMIIRLYFHKIKTYTKLMYEKELQTQKAINDAIHETQEQVLNNISQDLHDDAGQQLTYINFQLENLKLDSPKLESLLKPVSESVARLSESVRSISHSLNNQLVLQGDLLRAIRSEVDRIQNNKSVNIKLSTDNQTPRDFSSSEKIIIYRIFQESMGNILRHAKATEIAISLQSRPFSMSVSDNGIGFDLSSARQDSLGLAGMKRRANIIGYDIQIESEPNKGTTVRLIENSHGKDDHMPD